MRVGYRLGAEGKRLINRGTRLAQEPTLIERGADAPEKRWSPDTAFLRPASRHVVR
jgi:hypothetical protein